MGLDENFLKRVYKTSFYFFIFVVSLLGLQGLFYESINLGIGFVLSILLLYLLEWTVKKSFREKKKDILLKISLIKYPALFVTIYFLVKWEKINFIIFTLGFFIPYFIIFLKAVSIIITDRVKS